jgi:hypothetical protein
MQRIISQSSNESKSSSYPLCRKNLSIKNKLKSEAYRLSKLHNLNPSQEKVFITIVDSMSDSEVGTFGHQCIATKSRLSLSTVKRISAYLRNLKLISSTERQGWNIRKKKSERTNETRLLFTETKLPDVSVKLTHDPILDLLELKDSTNNITYEQHVCIFDNLPKTNTLLESNVKSFSDEEKLTCEKTTFVKHIDAQKLYGPEMEQEIIRAAEARDLSQANIQCAVVEMKENKTIKSKAAYLAKMFEKLKNNTWGKGRMLKKVDNQMKANYNSSSGNAGDTKMAYASYESRMRAQNIAQEANEMAVRELKALGIIDPMLKGVLVTYQESDEYSAMLATTRQKYITMLSSQISAKPVANEIDAGVDWSERAS